MQTATTYIRMLGATLAVGLIVLPCRAAPPIPTPETIIDSVMYRNPEMPFPRVVKGFPPVLVGLWVEALARPEAEYKCQAALAIASARKQGMTGLDATMAPLRRELDKPDVTPSARKALLRALVVLDARAAAPSMLRAAESGDSDVREIVDPALAHWNYQPARAVWFERLNDPLPGRGTILAVRALAAVREEKAAPRLRELVLSRHNPTPLRLESAQALGILRTSGSEVDSAGLAADTSPRAMGDRLSAAYLLRQHKSDEAVRQLQALATDPEPAVAAIALARLIEIDPKLVNPLLDRVFASLDAKVRGFGVETLFLQPTDANLKRLGDAMSDVHPDVRSKSRHSLRELAAAPEKRLPVIREATRILSSNDWRGQEQAAILLAQLDHKPAAGRMLELLNSGRGEPCVAAAWGLRKLARPDTLPPILEYFRRTVEYGRTAGRRKLPQAAVDQQLSQLAQFMGQSRYKPADAVLPNLIGPEVEAGSETRIAAIWALGWIHAGKPVPELVESFVGRIMAILTDDPRVRAMSAVALGLMRAEEALPTLRGFYRDKQPSFDLVNNACGWAIQQMTGLVVPDATVGRAQLNWFLAPVR
jgi:HEAT repeat protein